MSNPSKARNGAAQWVYFLGERNGTDIKIGRSGRRTIEERRVEVDRDQTTSSRYVVLAGFAGTRTHEKAIQRYFSEHQRPDKGSREEYFWPAPELCEYVAWCRQQWYCSTEGTDDRDGFPVEDFSHWEPRPERRVQPPELDPDVLVQNWDTVPGPLNGTTWAWMPNTLVSVQDYFTPTEIIDAARDAMGDVDLDAASHWLANKQHKVPDYFTHSRSAFENQWHGRVWLNPPYGEYGAWFERIGTEMDAGRVKQVCMLSPLWAFTTIQAKDFMRRVAASVILTPTPKFWGNPEGRTGTNQPHAVMYLGGRVQEFLAAFTEYGIPVEIKWDAVKLQDEFDEPVT